MRNNKQLFFLILVLTGILAGCQKPDLVKRSDQNKLADIFATLEGYGSSKLFDPSYSTNKDTVYFNIPWYYPVDSDNETDLKKIIVRTNVPTDATVSPMLGQAMDLSKPVRVTITSGTGQQSSFTVVGRRVADLGLRKASIEYLSNGATQHLDAIINANGDAIFYVLPGTDVSQAKLSYVLNPHSTGSVAQNTALDLTQPVPFTVTGVDGSKQTYTLKALEPRKLNYGVGISRLLWYKKNTDLSGLTTDDNNRSMAVSGNYLVVVVSSAPTSTYRIYDRFTGAYIRDMTLPPGAYRSFSILNDTAGHILVASWAPKGSDFIICSYKDPMDANPVQLLRWTNNNPAGIAGDGGVGRRVNIYGDIKGNAVIMATAGVSNVTYRWVISGGNLVSATPAALVYQSLAGTWGAYAEAQPVSDVVNGDYFVNYTAEIGLVSGSSNNRSGAFTTDTTVVGTGHLATEYFTFNNAKYLALGIFKGGGYSILGMSLFDITNPAKLGLKPSDPGFTDFRVFKSAENMTGGNNGNGAADVVSCYSEDRERVCVYTLLTNGGIMAHEFTKYAP